MAKIYDTVEESTHQKPNIGTGILRPKLKYQWRLGATGKLNDPALFKQVISCTRPSLTFDEIEIPRPTEDGTGMNTILVAGKHHWDPLTVVIEDDLHGSAARVIEKQFMLQMDAVTGNKPMASKFDMSICAMDGCNVVTDIWNIIGCFITEVNYADLDYSNSEAVHITLTVRFDHAEIETPLTFITD